MFVQKFTLEYADDICLNVKKGNCWTELCFFIRIMCNFVGFYYENKNAYFHFMAKPIMMDYQEYAILIRQSVNLPQKFMKPSTITAKDKYFAVN